MRAGKPSFTASAVAMARAASGCDDMATSLLEGPLAWAARVRHLGPAATRVLNLATLGLLDHIELRTRAIDAALGEGMEAGVTQVVLLGAGLDARAWRMPELSHAHVFEVDHPATQAHKRSCIAGRIPAACEVTYVAVDFAHDALQHKLSQAGHDPGVPTFWIWEGVTPYLPFEATRTTLVSVAALSAPGSRLAVTYGTPAATTLGPGLLRVSLLGFRAVGESIVGLVATEAMHAALSDVGFRVLADTAPSAWAKRYGSGRSRILLLDEHLAVALREPTSSG